MASEREHIEIGMTTAVKITDEDGVKWNEHFSRDVAFECNSLIVQVRAALSSYRCLQLCHHAGVCSCVIVQAHALVLS